MGDALCVPFFSFHEWKEKIAHLIFFLPFFRFSASSKSQGGAGVVCELFVSKNERVASEREREREREMCSRRVVTNGGN